MAQVKFYGLTEPLAARRAQLSDVVHACLVEVLGIPADKKFHRFIGLGREEFMFPSDRSSDYTIVEIFMMQGRTKAVRKKLIQMLFERCEDRLGLAASELEICIIESPPENWGFRGHTGDEIELPYRVKI